MITRPRTPRTAGWSARLLFTSSFLHQTLSSGSATIHPYPAAVQASRRQAVESIVTVVLAGVGIGCLTLLGQSVLGSGWHRLANSGAMWSLVAFAVGSRTASDRQAVIAGLATLLFAVVTYYAAAVFFVDAGAAPGRS